MIFAKKFHDFPEAASESVSAYTKEENGKTVPMWSNEEIKEIVTAQVVQKNRLFSLDFANSITFLRVFYFCWLVLTQRPTH